MKKSLVLAVGITFAVMFSGCSTSRGVVANPSAPRVDYRSVYIVTHGGNGADMDANMQREFLRHGFSVTAGDEGKAGSDAQLLVRYADDWKWDLAMYLRSLDVMVYDHQTNVLIATGSWKNSLFHGFYSSEKVVAEVVDDTVAKVSAR